VNSIFSFEQIFKFDKMITSKIIQGVYILGLVMTTLSGLFMFTKSFMLGLMIIVFGNLFLRIYCELVIVFFKIKDDAHDVKLYLAEIAESLQEKDNS